VGINGAANTSILIAYGSCFMQEAFLDFWQEHMAV
jgi:hypothetical protein